MIHEMEQRTDEWFEVRLGRITASRIREVLPQNGNINTTKLNYFAYQLAAQILTGESDTPDYQSAAMLRGTELESEAREAYQMIAGVEVQEVGFVTHDVYPAGCSPDGLIGDDGGLEIKCPLGATQLKYLVNKKLPAEYFPQVQFSLWLTGRKWWDFFSYHPRLKPLLVRVEPDKGYFDKLNEVIEKLDIKIKTIIKEVG